ncbi:TPA: hypothetical protein ACH3X3_010078 [Trebouxia sp. C0006]
MQKASPAELQQALTDRHAVELDGAWRTVDKSYMKSLLETALFLAIQLGWSYTALSQQDLQANGRDARCILIKSRWEHADFSGFHVGWWVEVFCLANASMAPALSAHTPWDMTPDLSMLRGIPVQEDTGTQKLVKLFNVQQLPCEPAARFKAVFQERAQWSWQDLQPYVEDLQVWVQARA